MADHLASIYGTEKDKVNCSFYYKIGACRHGETCSRKHVKPKYSCTMEHFDAFYEDIFTELAQYGEIEEMHICDNVGDHLIGNIYVRFVDEDCAAVAVEELNKRYYAGRPIYAELSPVTDFRESCCRQYDNGECTRGQRASREHFDKIRIEIRKRLAKEKGESFAESDYQPPYRDSNSGSHVRDRSRERDRYSSSGRRGPDRDRSYGGGDRRRY